MGRKVFIGLRMDPAEIKRIERAMPRLLITDRSEYMRIAANRLAVDTLNGRKKRR